MPVSKERKPFRIAALITPLFIGLLGLYNVMQSSHFASYRTVDVIRLVAGGACLGAVLVGLMVMLLRPRV